MTQTFITAAGFLRAPIADEQRFITRDFLKYQQTLEKLARNLQQFTVAALPSSPTPLEGAIAFATNGRKQGEGLGAGTGVACYFSNLRWRRFSDDTQVLA